MHDVAGSLVEVRGLEDLGTGRVSAVTSGKARVEWFESIAQPMAHVEVVPVEDCRRKALVTQDARVLAAARPVVRRPGRLG